MPVEHSVENELTVPAFAAAFESRIGSDFFFAGEAHDPWELVYVISGSINVTADTKVFHLTEGDIIFHKPREFHSLAPASNSSAHVFIMSFTLCGRLAKKLENCVVKLNPSQQDIMSLLITSFRTDDSSNELTRLPDYFGHWLLNPIAAQIAKNYAEILFLDIIQSSNKPKPVYNTRSAEVYHNIISIMTERIYEWITIEEIAKYCNFSTAYIKKIFAQYSECGIHSYFLKMKLQKAVLLMRNGKSVQQTSNLLSFSNTNYFSVVFKREFGMSPRNYMKQYIENSNEKR